MGLKSPRLWIGIALFGVLVWLSGVAIDGLRKDPRFLATPTFMRGAGPDWGGSSVVDPVVQRLQRLGPINLFDAEFAAKVTRAMFDVPGVKTVDSVRRIWPRQYAVSFEMHRPIAIVFHNDERIPVTRDGVVLPGEPYTTAANGLLQIRGVHTDPPAPGRTWKCGSLQDGLAAVVQLQPHRVAIAPLGIEWVDVSGAFQSRLGVVLYGAHDITIRWGRPLSEIGENSVELKIELLMGAVRRMDRAKGRELDVRWDHMVTDG